jgi:hypothetical protein
MNVSGHHLEVFRSARARCKLWMGQMPSHHGERLGTSCGEPISVAASSGTMAARVTASQIVQIALPGTAIRTEHSAHGDKSCRFVIVNIAQPPYSIVIALRRSPTTTALLSIAPRASEVR